MSIEPRPKQSWRAAARAADAAERVLNFGGAGGRSRTLASTNWNAALSLSYARDCRLLVQVHRFNDTSATRLRARDGPSMTPEQPDLLIWIFFFDDCNQHIERNQ